MLERVGELTTVLLVEQNLGVVRRIARDAVVLDQGRVVHDERRAGAARRPELVRRLLSVSAEGTHDDVRPADDHGPRARRDVLPIASGLSLIYGLMGVLNFAHGAYLTVGSYASWWMSANVFDGVGSLLLRFLLGAICGLAAGGAFAALVELVLIRPLYQRHIEQVLVTVGLSIAFVALVQGIWGPERSRTRCPPGCTTRRRSSARTSRTTASSRSAPRPRCSSRLQLFLRRTRYGLIIRAGVENRAMVTALGIDVRKAFTLVFALGGVAAAIAGVLSGVYFSTIDPSAGDEPADLRLHRRRDRRARLDRRLGDRGRRRRAAPAVRELLRVVRDRRPRGRAAARRSCCSSARAGSRERRRVTARRRHDFVWPLAVFGALAFVPKIALDIPKRLRRRDLEPGDAAAARALPAVRRARAHVRPALRLHRVAVVRSRAVRRGRRLHGEHRGDGLALELRRGAAVHRAARFVVPLVLGAVSLRVGGIAFAMVTLAFAQAGAVLVHKDPHHWTHGEEGLGVDYHKLPDAFVGIFNTKYLYWLALGYLAVVFFIVRWAVESSPGRVWQAIRENELRVEVLGLRPRAYKLMSFVLASFLATRGRHRLPAALQQLEPGRDRAELHALAAADGRDRRSGHALGRGARRRPLHVPRQPARRDRRLVDACRTCRRCCARRSSSRSSCSARSSS